MSVSNTGLEGVVDAEILPLEEELAGKNVEAFKGRISGVIEAGRIHIILDCKALKVLSSEGLEALLWVIEEVQGKGGLVKIASLAKVPRRVFEVTQFNRIFEIYDDVIAAMRSL